MSKNIFFKSKGPFKLNVLFPKQSTSNTIIRDIKTLDKAEKSDLTFFDSLRYKDLALKTKASCCITKENLKKYDVIVGMYHDQVLTPMKTIFEYDAINITLGLPFLRISPDHGPNEKMMGKNLSNPLSLIQAIKFLENN